MRLLAFISRYYNFKRLTELTFKILLELRLIYTTA